MSVKNSVLEKFDNNKLLNYLKADSKYVGEAIQYAFEILQKRGVEFSEEEIN